MTDDYHVYQPSELLFDVAYDSYESEIVVYVVDKETERHDSMGDHNVKGLPDYLGNNMENEWSPFSREKKTIEEVKADMIAAGFEYRENLIDWIK